MDRGARLIVLGVWCALGALACTEDPPADPPVCVPGQSVLCVCENRAEGAQACREDGTGFESCECARQPRDVGDDDAGGPPDGDDAPERPDTPDTDTDTDAVADTDDAETRDAPEDEPEPDTEPPEDTRPAEDPDVSLDSDAPEDAAPPEDTEPPDDAVGDAREDTEEEPPGRLRTLGEDCGSDGQCESAACLEMTTSLGDVAVCGTPCCHEAECPGGFGCLQAGGGTYCLPARIFPGATFTGCVGDHCATAGFCKSDLCDGRVDFCRGSCCTDGDCSATPCHWTSVPSGMRAYCNPLGLLGGGAGTPCFSEVDCWSGVCTPSPSAGTAVCADLCCGASDCGFGLVCGLIAGPRGTVARACVEAPGAGTGGTGVACGADGDCANFLCIDGRCTTPCCLDRDCTVGDRCLPRRTPEGVVTTVCAPP